jgi:membrane-bound serine protease (ClpP class)
VFVLLAVVLIVLEIAVSGFGILGVGAMVSLMVGGVLLFNQFGDTSPTLPSIDVNRWLLASSGGVVGVSLIYFVKSAYQSRREGPPTKVSDLIGTLGRVTGELAPRGIVLVGNKTWTAVSEDASVIATGEQVQVRSVDGLILTVSPQFDPENEIDL